jgi:hypothetical protein
LPRGSPDWHPFAASYCSINVDTGDHAILVSNSHWLARNIPGARLFEQPGIDHAPWRSNVVSDLIEEVRHFLTGSRGPVGRDRVLATVLFTDIVGSTESSNDSGLIFSNPMKMTVHPARAAFSMSSGASLPRELCCSSCGGRHRFARNEAAERAFRQWRPREDDVQDAQDPTQGPAA